LDILENWGDKVVDEQTGVVEEPTEKYDETIEVGKECYGKKQETNERLEERELFKEMLEDDRVVHELESEFIFTGGLVWGQVDMMEVRAETEEVGNLEDRTGVKDDMNEFLEDRPGFGANGEVLLCNKKKYWRNLVA
jgi:hypothetical protein